MKENVTVPAVERALNVLEYFSLNNDEKSLKAIGDDLDIPSASLFRIIKNLVSRGYLLQVESNPPKYVLGYKIPQLASRYSDNYTIANVIKPYMERLSQRTNQTVQFAVERGKQIIYIEQVLSAAPVNFIAHLYTPMEINTSAGAKCILAQWPAETQKRFLKETVLQKKTEKTIVDKEKYLEELRITRERGYGLDYEEFNKGICCIAAPVFGSDHECIGAIGVTGGSEEYKNNDKFEVLKNNIIETAGLISAKIS